MPNWCENIVTFKHEDTAQIERLVQAYNGDKLFGEFFPCPPSLLEGSGWYEWCNANWGTKWDINTNGDTCQYDPGSNEITVNFDTAWSPPIAFYQEMEDEMGFEVEAFYSEPGMAFTGRYSDGDNDHYSDIDADNLASVPENIVEMFGLDSWFEDDFEDDNDKEEK